MPCPDKKRVRALGEIIENIHSNVPLSNEKPITQKAMEKPGQRAIQAPRYKSAKPSSKGKNLF